MPRYVVERTFPDGLQIAVADGGDEICGAVVARNSDEGVTWVHSYFTPDRTKSFCIYDGPNPDAIRKAAQRTKIPVDKITEVQVLDPYFFRVD